jgi:c-di-GMP-binding flagellar brake protein YcgR
VLDDSRRSGRVVDNKQEIASILGVARTHGWSFSFSISGKAGETPYRTEIARIDPALEFVAFGSEVNTLNARLSKGLRFRTQNAGISIQFESQIIVGPKNSGECLVKLPDQLLYSQKRQAIRVNFANLETIPVTLFTGNNEHINGTVEDISASGVKARFPGYLVEHFQASRMITDCGLRLPDDTELQGRVQVLGTLYDFEKDISYVRCCFLRLQDDGELKISELINNILKNMALKKLSV